ncbi:MAG: hypothetical protein SXG53_04165, partial [Pseudomonadota bacterium]|nr:hypothetical protein [Pseudomonadota bacterium]
MAFQNHVRLPFDAGCGKPCLRMSIIVDGGASDYGVDAIPRTQGISKPLQNDNSCAIAENGPGRFGIKSSAASIGRQDAAFAIHITSP